MEDACCLNGETVLKSISHKNKGMQVSKEKGERQATAHIGTKSMSKCFF